VETQHQEKFIREYAALLWKRAAEAPEAPPLERELSRQRSAHEEECLVGSDLFGDASEAAGSREEPQASAGKVGSKAKRAEKEIERMRKEAQKRAPKYLLTCGLPGAGKSTFSCALERTGNCVRANQDDLGRKGCIEVVSKTVPLVKKGAKLLIIDRCNPTRAERKEWLDLIGRPPAAEVVCVFFDSSPEDCKKRAAARLDHPTIRAGGGGRIIDDQAKKFERPDRSEGFCSVEVVKTFEDAGKLLRRFGATDTSVPSSSDACSTSGGGYYASVSVPAVSADTVATGCEESGLEPEHSNSLPSRFQKWLNESLCEELTAADAEGILAAVEVILTCEGEVDDREEQLAAAIQVLQDNGAPESAADLAAQWYAATIP
jgi:predicted kinase